MLVCLLAYAWPVMPGTSVNPDSHLALTYAIVDEHTFIIDRYVVLWGIMDRAVQNDHNYTDKLPMESFLAVPPYAGLRLFLPPAHTMDESASARLQYALTLLVVSLPAALGVGLLRSELIRLGSLPGTATLAALG